MDATTALPVRHIRCEAAFNVRDLGGYRGVDDRTIRWRTLFRADGLHRVGADELDQLGLRTVIDLRSPAEIETGMYAAQATDTMHLPILRETWKETQFVDDGDHVGFLVGRYLEMLDEGGAAFGAAVAVLAESDRLPAAFHCAAGKDRTGVLAAIVLSVLGVSDHQIAADYHLSALAMDQLVAWLAANRPDLVDLMVQQPKHFLACPPEAMLELLDRVRARYGSPESYLRDAGLSADAIAALRANLLEQRALTSARSRSNPRDGSSPSGPPDVPGRARGLDEPPSVGHSHEHRPFVSRRQFLRRVAIAGGAAAAGPHFWRQLANAAEAPVRQLHLTFGKDASKQVNVSWMTSAAVAAPFVEVAGHRFPARTVQYAGYPGFFHHAPLTGLTADTLYAYEVGHAGKRTGRTATFRSGPAPGTPFTFTAFGDQGTDDGGLGQPPNQPTMNTDLAASLDPKFHLIVGDLSYANGDQAIWDSWFDLIEPMAQTKPWMPTLGNHEIESQLTGDAADSWGDWGYDPYRSRFILPGNGHTDLKNCYYAFRYGSVHVVCIDNNDVNDEVTNNIGYTGGRQQQFVEAELRAARSDPSVDFIVVGMHQCAFSSSTKHGSDPGVQKAWFELFHRYSVDLVLQGHDHTYERSHAMVGDRVVSEGPVYNSDVGTVYVVCGNGGAVQEPFNPVQPAWSAFRQALKVGTMQIEVQPDAGNGKKRLVLSERWALDGSPIEDGIVLERSGSHEDPTAGAAASPRRTVEAASAPAGASLVGVAAGTSGLALRTLSREERRQELADAR